MSITPSPHPSIPTQLTSLVSRTVNYCNIDSKTSLIFLLFYSCVPIPLSLLRPSVSTCKQLSFFSHLSINILFLPSSSVEIQRTYTQGTVYICFTTQSTWPGSRHAFKPTPMMFRLLLK